MRWLGGILYYVLFLILTIKGWSNLCQRNDEYDIYTKECQKREELQKLNLDRLYGRSK